MIKGVFFDLCGTLLTYGDMDAAWAYWLEVGFFNFHNAGWKGTLSEFQTACDGLFSLPEPTREDDGLTVYERRLKRLGEKIGCNLTIPQLQQTAMSTVRTWADRMYLDPQANELLTRLKERFYLALITNYDHPPYIEMALDHHALRPFFSKVIISSRVGYSKPDPRIFQMALKTSGLAPHEVIFVGDNLKDDIAGAQEAGLHPIFILRDPSLQTDHYDYHSTPTQKQVPADNHGTSEVKTIHSLTELLEIF